MDHDDVGGPDDPMYDPPGPLPEDESVLVEQDLHDLDDFERVFADEGVKGVALWCHDCEEEHYYPWELLRGSLNLLLETGEVPVHEPAFAPDPDDYVPWEYARGYVDALRDVGVDERVALDACPRCMLELGGALQLANWCPRCATPLLGARLRVALLEAGLDERATEDVLRAAGLPG